MVDIEYGIEIVPYYPIGKLEKLVKRVEELGFDYVWVSDHCHNRYFNSILAHLTKITKSVNLGPGVTNPYLSHPAIIASGVAALEEMSGGRTVLGISAGDKPLLKSLGVSQDRPITVVREAVQIIKKLLGGDKLEYSGQFFKCRGAKLEFFPDREIPVYIGGRGRQMLELAGSIGDGALFNTANPKDLKRCIDFIEKGVKKEKRNIENFKKVAYMATSLDEDAEKARKRVRTIVAHIASAAPKSTIERENISKARLRNIQNYLEWGKRERAKSEVTRKMIEAFSITGKIGKLKSRVEKVKNLEINQIVFGSPLGPKVFSALEKIADLI